MLDIIVLFRNSYVVLKFKPTFRVYEWYSRHMTGRIGKQKQNSFIEAIYNMNYAYPPIYFMLAFLTATYKEFLFGNYKAFCYFVLLRSSLNVWFIFTFFRQKLFIYMVSCL